jgi:hypothetical protein
VRLLRGESPASVKTVLQVAGRSTYDWRELQRWGISAARLPAESIVLFRPPGVWDQYKGYIVSTVQFSARGSLESLDIDVALCVYRGTQEALTNALRHAHAHSLLVELTATDDIELRVVDDGVGFVADERAGSGLGLRSINERVRLAHGTVRIESRQGEGTALLVRIPLAAKAPPRPPQDLSAGNVSDVLQKRLRATKPSP